MSRPDYSGKWQFDGAASALEIRRPEAVVFAIDHREPFFHLERTLTFAGQTDRFAIDLTVGADPAPLSRGDATLYPSLRWEENQLVFLTRIVRGGEESTNWVRYHLEEAGSVLVAEERFRSRERNYDNRWVFNKR